MGFLDNIMNAARALSQEQGGAAAAQGQPQQQQRSMLDGIVDMFKNDGVSTIIDRFRQQGLGDLVSSWIGTGSNRPISADQLRSVLGPERIRQLAQRAGITEDRVPDFLKDLLPNVVDRATPNGSVDPDDSGQQ
ncbi:MAG: DUF937 domain-containing protein [Spirochaetes bacterium]|nr:DUF937 domain-containing protein [Spirochaetota bacterium]